MLIKSPLELSEYVKGNIKFNLNIEFALYFEDPNDNFFKINCVDNAISISSPVFLHNEINWHFSSRNIRFYPIEEVDEQYITKKLRRARTLYT